MPFCSQCGNRVQDEDRFCAKCGNAQPGTAGTPPPGGRAGFAPGAPADPLSALSPRTASILCYIPAVGWIAAVVVLATSRFRDNYAVRFHAFQALYLFAVYLLVQWAVRPIFQSIPGPVVRVDRVLLAIIAGVCVFMMVKASQGERYALPVLGDLAERSSQES